MIPFWYGVQRRVGNVDFWGPSVPVMVLVFHRVVRRGVGPSMTGPVGNPKGHSLSALIARPTLGLP